MKETYLGDGLYASFDGWHIILRAPRDGGDHYVALEPEVFAALLDYRRETLDALHQPPAPTEGEE